MNQFDDEMYEVKHKLLIENTQQLILFFENDGTIKECNSFSLNELGYGDEIYHIRIYEIFKEAFHLENNQMEIKAKFLQKAEETVAYRKNQTCLSIYLKIAIEKVNKGYIGICSATRNTVYKETIRKIRNLEEEKKEMNLIEHEAIANITHELRTPANGIMGLSNNLLETELTLSQRETVNLIKTCCNNLNNTINDILDFEKLNSNKLILEQREFCFLKFIHNIIDFNRIRINDKGLKLLINISDDIPNQLIGDEYRLTQILNNLFSNAVKFTEIGEIALEIIKTVQTDQYVELFFMLMDTGIGISVKDKDKLFQSFTQLDSSITRRYGGTGLGLAISKKLVEAMQGSIMVDSEKNKGSTFSFSVRLGVPKPEPGSGYRKKEIEAKTFEGFTNSEHSNDSTFLSSLEYFNMILKAVNISYDEDVDQTNAGIYIMKKIPALLERLVICIEMESWEQAGKIAECLKKMVPEGHGDSGKLVFRLLLMVRKENRDASLQSIKEIRNILNER
ncbi:MAG: ATP-binding protein [Herbinix sp.]|nr:ATP-binding protein [Herbinix sp.]